MLMLLQYNDILRYMANATKTQQPPLPKKHRMLKWIISILATLALIVIAIMVAFQVSPWPSSLLIRHEFNKGAVATSDALEKHVPAGIGEVKNQQYELNNDTFLDAYYPEGQNRKELPVIVWVHGGAWISGNKNNVANYAKIVASHGFSTVSINYSIAPEKKYPTPIFQLNTALKYLQDNADRLELNMDKVMFAGDSAGSQIVAQMANIITSSDYAREIGVEPTLASSKLKGLLLNCGAYDLELANNSSDEQAKQFLDTVLWAYSGTKDYVNKPEFRHASVADYVTGNFPPSFITAGNIDPLEEQSREFAKKLASQNVTTKTLFYPKDHSPALSHEYQFNLDNQDGKNALNEMVAFAKEVSR